ncbi:MAG: YceI family protein [Gammaproteobacteria bacterium]|nr:YceI family protein [Gammaproteobacteria bacterium]
MKKSVAVTLLVSLALFLSAELMAADYVIDARGQHVAVIFKASHLGYSYNIGRFNTVEGNYSYDKSDPSASRVNVVIDAKSLDTNHAERDKHLRGDKFFDVTKYPTVTFDSTSYTNSSNGDVLKGNLTLHGVTREVTIAVRHIGEGKDPWGGYRSGFEGKVTISAADFGMPKWVGDVEVDLIVEGIRQ